jgi:endonuclease-3
MVRARITRSENLDERKARARKILTRLRRVYGPATCALQHDSALQLLIATILSAQSTDDTVNRITPELFAKYRTAGDFANAPREALQAAIRPSGFFRQKAKSIQAACAMLVGQHDGEVPDTMAQLIALPGVARKTANVVLGTWFGRNEGVVVDTHVGRLGHRLALTWTSKDAKDAVRIEQDLMQIVPRRSWTYFSHALIWHGRKVCTARKPQCTTCPLRQLCPSADGGGEVK